MSDKNFYTITGPSGQQFKIPISNPAAPAPQLPKPSGGVPIPPEFLLASEIMHKFFVQWGPILESSGYSNTMACAAMEDSLQAAMNLIETGLIKLQSNKET